MNLVPKANFASRSLYHHDNLPVLRGMNSRTVHLIATDPPFNKGKDFHATPESVAAGASFQDRWSWDTDVHEEWVDSLSENWPKTLNVIQGSRQSYGDDMGAFLCFMAVRLIEMRRVLKDEGSIYLHCDPTASHYLKELMDAIFGRQNFRNEIIWHYDGPQRPSDRDFATKHDVLLRYSKTKKYFAQKEGIKPLRVISEEELRQSYKKHTDGRWYYDLPRGDYTDDSIRRLEKEGRIRRTRTGKVRVMYFLSDDGKGNVRRAKQLHDVWSDIPSLGQVSRKEKTGYPTQKPLALYERIIAASSKEGDMVLDPFCGCATTPIAAERLDRQWVGVDIWDKAHEIVIERLEKEGLIRPSGGKGGRLFHKGMIGYLTEPPERSDEGGETAPDLATMIRRYAEEPGPRMTRKEIIAKLIEQYGMICLGCLREFDDPLYLQLDHNVPKSQGGVNHISNRMLLCGPCNRIKGDTLTLKGLRNENKRRSRMAKGV